MKITQILASVQNTTAAHHKYVKELEDLLKKDGVDTCFQDFKRYLIIAFSKDLKVRNQYMDRYYDFCINFIDAIESKGNDSEESVFPVKIFDTVFNCLEVLSVDIRYHACLFIHKYILYLIKKDKTINETLYEKITEAILDTLEDINPQIRIISANILKLIQNSEGSEDFSSAFIDNLGDSNGKVRGAIVDALVPTADNLPHIINRARDVDEGVRITVFKKVADIPVQMFTIEQRQFLLKNGLRDRSERVNKCLETTVLPSWLKYYEGDYIKFLKALQLDSNKKEIDDTKIVSQLVLKSLFSSRPIQEILETLFLEEKLIPLEQLTWESAFFWKTLIHHLKTKNLEQYWELILPETLLFCNYIEKFCSSTHLQTGSIWEQQHYLLIFHELLYIVLGCDITDEASRRRLHSFLVKTLKERKVSEEIIKDIVKYFKVLIPNVEQRVNFFCEMISDIRSPLVPAVPAETFNEYDEKKREISQKLKKLLSEKAKTIEDQDFDRTKQIVLEISNAKEILQSIEEEESALLNEEEHQEKINDPEIVTKCLDIALALLDSTQSISINPAIKSLKEEIFMEIMTCKDVIMQAKYFKCYGVICSLDKIAAEENIQFFCLPLTLYTKDKSGEIEVLKAVIDVVGDLILIYGSKILPVYESNDDSNGSLDFDLIYGKNQATINEVVDILSSMLDDTNDEIRISACEVLIKLMLTRRIESPELFSRLFVKWLSPASVEDIRLRQTIGVFIEMFSQLPDVEQQLEESVIPILRTISLAPLTSPLSNISKEELLKLIIKIINLRQDVDYTIHENLAMSICMEIQKDYDSKCVPLFVKSLLFFELYRDDNVYIENLLNLCEDILIELKDRLSINNMKKFIFSLKHE